MLVEIRQHFYSVLDDQVAYGRILVALPQDLENREIPTDKMAEFSQDLENRGISTEKLTELPQDLEERRSSAKIRAKFRRIHQGRKPSRVSRKREIF